MENFKIGVFFSDGKQWKLLPETSRILSEKNIIPVHGDRITTVGEDYKLMNLNSVGNLASVITVKDRVHRYVNCDLAVVCEHQQW